MGESKEESAPLNCVSPFGAGMPNPGERLGFNLTYKKCSPQNSKRGRGLAGSQVGWVGLVQNTPPPLISIACSSLLLLQCSQELRCCSFYLPTGIGWVAPVVPPNTDKGPSTAVPVRWGGMAGRCLGQAPTVAACRSMLQRPEFFTWRTFF